MTTSVLVEISPGSQHFQAPVKSVDHDVISVGDHSKSVGNLSINWALVLYNTLNYLLLCPYMVGPITTDIILNMMQKVLFNAAHHLKMVGFQQVYFLFFEKLATLHKEEPAYETWFKKI